MRERASECAVCGWVAAENGGLGKGIEAELVGKGKDGKESERICWG